jgi:hypothetical protein
VLVRTESYCLGDSSDEYPHGGKSTIERNAPIQRQIWLEAEVIDTEIGHLDLTDATMAIVFEMLRLNCEVMDAPIFVLCCSERVLMFAELEAAEF